MYMYLKSIYFVSDRNAGKKGPQRRCHSIFHCKCCDCCFNCCSLILYVVYILYTLVKKQSTMRFIIVVAINIKLLVYFRMKTPIQESVTKGWNVKHTYQTLQKGRRFFIFWKKPLSRG